MNAARARVKGTTHGGDVERAIRVPPGFTAEFPDASAPATEAFLNLGVLMGGVQSAVEDLLRAHGITSLAAFNVLTVIDGDPEPLRPSTVAGRMMVSRATMTGLLDSLERRGLLVRTVSGDDGRQRLVSLTPKGRRLVRRVVPEMHRFERDFMACLDDDELGALLTAAAKLQRHLASVAPRSRLGIPG